MEIEIILLLLSNIVFIVHGLYMTFNARRWRQSADFIGSRLRLEECKTIEKPKTREKLVFASPKYLKTYISQVQLQT